jgi:SnoaL-like domain
MEQPAGYLGDRLEIDDLLTRYASAIDTREWDVLDSVFTADAELDYRSAGGIKAAYPEIKAWLAEVLPIFTWTQHLVLNRAVRLDPAGASGRARSGFLNPNGLMVHDKPWLFTVGGYYHDHLARTKDGWRITSRLEETLWWSNPMPGLPDEPYPIPDA